MTLLELKYLMSSKQQARNASKNEEAKNKRHNALFSLLTKSRFPTNSRFWTGRFFSHTKKAGNKTIGTLTKYQLYRCWRKGVHPWYVKQVFMGTCWVI